MIVKRIPAILIFIMAWVFQALAAPVKWACIGNSITQGSNGPSYVTKLAALLGPGYALENDGVSGTTLLKKGDNPYWKNGKLANVFALQPDIVSIKLGTNDSKAWNWKFGSGFEADLIALIDTLGSIPSHPKIWLVLPCPAFANAFAIDDAVIGGSILPIYRKVAAAKGLDLIDANTPLQGHPEFFGDGVHPNSAGADAIAGAFYRALAGKASPAAPPYRVHCGGEDFQDANGNAWWPDAAYAVGGKHSTFTAAVGGTPQPRLYQSERWDDGFAKGMGFSFPIPDARKYVVRLHFAELNPPSAAVGARIFHVRVNGAAAWDSLDIFKEAGFAKALVKETKTAAAAGKIQIQFESLKDAAKINGVEIFADTAGTGISRREHGRERVSIPRFLAPGNRDVKGRLW